MLHELRVYTLKAGALPKVLEANATIGREVRGDNYGKLEGYWFTEIGPLNQVFHLWSYEDMAERTRLRAELGKLPAWRDDYVAAVRPHIVKQQIRFLDPVRPITAPAQGGNIYEYRNYRLRPGSIGEWVAAINTVMPTREKYSKNVGLWASQAGDPNEVCHMWAYDSFETRMAVRGEVAKDPEWQKFAAYGGPHLEEMHSTLLFPASFSPLQ